MGDGEGQGSLVCCSSWGHKELDTFRETEQQQQGIALIKVKRMKKINSGAIEVLRQPPRKTSREGLLSGPDIHRAVLEQFAVGLTTAGPSVIILVSRKLVVTLWTRLFQRGGVPKLCSSALSLLLAFTSFLSSITFVLLPRLFHSFVMYILL